MHEANFCTAILDINSEKIPKDLFNPFGAKMYVVWVLNGYLDGKVL